MVLDAEVFKRMLCSKNYAQDGKMLREEISLMCFRLCTMHHCPGLLAPLTSCRLLALDKNPGVQPIGVGEVLRRLLGKCIVHAFKDTIKEATRNLQTCAGFEAGAEAAIHAMKELYEEENSEAVIMIDASNAFNSMNRAVALNNIQVLCPTIATYLINTYRQPSRLFVIGGRELKSSEGTTQGDPRAMPWFSINTRRLINVLAEQTEVKQACLADDATGCGSIANFWKWYGKLIEKGKKDGYFVNKLKCWLVVKSESLSEKAKVMFNRTIKVTTAGKRHLGAALGPQDFKTAYCKDKIEKWAKELNVLSGIAVSQPHPAFSAFSKGFKSKFTYFFRTMPEIADMLEPIECVLENKLIPALFGSESPLENN